MVEADRSKMITRRMRFARQVTNTTDANLQHLIFTDFHCKNYNRNGPKLYVLYIRCFLPCTLSFILCSEDGGRKIRRNSQASSCTGFSVRQHKFKKYLQPEYRPICLYFNSLRLVTPLNTKRRLLYLKTQFVPRCKHFSSQL